VVTVIVTATGPGSTMTDCQCTKIHGEQAAQPRVAGAAAGLSTSSLGGDGGAGSAGRRLPARTVTVRRQRSSARVVPALIGIHVRIGSHWHWQPAELDASFSGPGP
jgi:hypothetical protein